jgi:hypothetical protein
MKKIERMMQPLSKHEDDFIIMVSRFSGIGYGRMKQIITGIWANILMESSTMDEMGALLGALDLDTWTAQHEKEKQKLLKLVHRANELLAVKSGYDFYDDEFEAALKDYRGKK